MGSCILNPFNSQFVIALDLAMSLEDAAMQSPKCSTLTCY